MGLATFGPHTAAPFLPQVCAAHVAQYYPVLAPQHMHAYWIGQPNGDKWCPPQPGVPISSTASSAGRGDGTGAPPGMDVRPSIRAPCSRTLKAAFLRYSGCLSLDKGRLQLKRGERVEYVDLRIARCLQSAWMGRKPRRQGGSAEAVPCDGKIFSDGKVAIHACLD